MWLGTKMEDESIIEPLNPPNSVNCDTRNDAFQPGNIISKCDPANNVYYKKTDANIGYRILLKSAWAGGKPKKARLYLHKSSDGGNPILIREYNTFTSWTLSYCNSQINDPRDYWYYKDDTITFEELGQGPWAIRLEVDFICPGAKEETVFAAPYTQKNKVDSVVSKQKSFSEFSIIMHKK